MRILPILAMILILAAPIGLAAGDQKLEPYLERKFSCEITRVAVGEDLVRIEGEVAAGSRDVFLADIPMDVEMGSAACWQTMLPLEPAADGKFAIDVPRHRQRDGRDYDRLSSRWQLAHHHDKAWEPMSHARYAEEVDCRSPQLPPASPKNKKGLGGWQAGRLPDELDDLGISSVTLNVMVHRLVALEPGEGRTPIEWQGRTYYANDRVLEHYDRSFLAAQERGAMVSAILLVANPAKDPNPVVQIIGHPDATREGIFAMPNVTSADGIALYGAILNLMAERWSREDGKFGRVHHWIVHNEVDAGWVWTNAGERDAVSYMDLYQRSLRLTDLIARQYDPNSLAFMSLTQHWAHHGAEHWHGSKRLTELLLKFCAAEGDFPWAMAYHPYPQDLTEPRTWEDEQATFSFDSPKITPKNLEVLDAYMRQPALLYRGEGRPVHLSENGFNSKDYSAKSLEEQAAGMAYAWKKIQALSSIQAWQYHNWIDNRHEGGLRIGLRKFDDEKGDPLGKKPIWHLYQALGTEREDKLAAPYLKTIGITSWAEILHKEPIQ